jgi:hypothetical protein
VSAGVSAVLFHPCVDELLPHGGLKLDNRTYDREVGELQSIGYNGQPVQQAFRRVDPPVAVLVDLAALFPREPHRTGGYNPAGLQMHSVVEGELSCWGICEQGHWWGLVTYDIAYGTRRRAVTHWIPAWMLKRTATPP